MNRDASRVLYVGDKDSLHHQRFIRLLQSNFETRTVFTESGTSIELRDFAPNLVICAPLQEPLRYALSTFSVPIIGISWALELNEPRRIYETDSDFSLALSKLSGLIVDNHYHVYILRRNLNLNIPIQVVTFNLEPLPKMPLNRTLDKSKKIIISARSFEPLYRNDLILESISSFTEEESFVLMMAGGGSQLEELKAIHSKQYMKNRLLFLGPVSNNRLLHLMSESHLYVSAAQSDGISVTLLEAMQFGLVCLVSDFPTNVEVISHGFNGFLFANGDSHSFKSELKSILNLDEDQLDSISTSAKRTVEERFSWHKSSSTFLHFISSFLV